MNDDVDGWFADPYLVARRSIEKEYMRYLAAAMKKMGITQIDLSDVDLIEGKDTLAIERNDYGAPFIRIKGTFELKDQP